LKAELPVQLGGRHFGPELVIEWILSKGYEQLHAEKDALLQAGLSSSSYVTVDDSGLTSVMNALPGSKAQRRKVA